MTTANLVELENEKRTARKPVSASTTLRMFPDCRLVRGAARCAIYDLTRKDLYTFSAKHVTRMASMLGEEKKLLLEQATADEVTGDILDFLLSNELAYWSDGALDRLQEIEEEAPPPGLTSSIIDVTRPDVDFATYFRELSSGSCEYCQIREFNAVLGASKLRELVGLAAKSTLRAVELVLAFASTGRQRAELENLLKDNRIISRIVVHSAPSELCKRPPESRRAVWFLEDRVSGKHCCGVITARLIAAPSAPSFAKMRVSNGCLGGKVSVDADGNIRTCPSMPTVYGVLGKDTFQDVIARGKLRDEWSIRKDQIEVCRDCEYRYACSDCRAYTVPDGSRFGKPRKCSYDPYTGVWEKPFGEAFGGHYAIRRTEIETK